MSGGKYTQLTWKIPLQTAKTLAEDAVRKAVESVKPGIARDCNYYCKLDTGALMETARNSVNTGDYNEIIWSTPYAQYQYFLTNTRTVKNPNASPRWCERAYTAHKDEWLKEFANALKEELK